MNKSCPFCGGDSLWPQYGVDSCKYGAIQCGCGAQGPDVRTKYDDSSDAPWHKDAWEAWNERSNK